MTSGSSIFPFFAPFLPPLFPFPSPPHPHPHPSPPVQPPPPPQTHPIHRCCRCPQPRCTTLNIRLDCAIKCDPKQASMLSIHPHPPPLRKQFLTRHIRSSFARRVNHTPKQLLHIDLLKIASEVGLTELGVEMGIHTIALNPQLVQQQHNQIVTQQAPLQLTSSSPYPSPGVPSSLPICMVSPWNPEKGGGGVWSDKRNQYTIQPMNRYSIPHTLTRVFEAVVGEDVVVEAEIVVHLLILLPLQHPTTPTPLPSKTSTCNPHCQIKPHSSHTHNQSTPTHLNKGFELLNKFLIVKIVDPQLRPSCKREEGGGSWKDENKRERLHSPKQINQYCE